VIYLCTNIPGVDISGDKIIVTMPSGREDVQIAMTLNQALMLQQGLKEAVHDAFSDGGFASATDAQCKAIHERRPNVRNRQKA